MFFKLTFMSRNISLFIAPPIDRFAPNLAQSLWVMSEASDLSFMSTAFTLTKIRDGKCFFS